MSNKKFLIVVCGPTAVGKTALSIELAQYFNCEILSADSRQFYKEMSIGTAKPSIEEMNGVFHHFIDNKSIQEEYSAGQFEIEALAALDQIYQKNNVAILVGGSGLFINALTDGLDDIPATPLAIREKLNRECEELGLEEMVKRLRKIDPQYLIGLDLKNTHRVLRGLEVYETTGQKLSDLQLNEKKNRPFKLIQLGLDLPRTELYERINRRVDSMIEQGLVEEVKSLLPFQELSPLKTVGYQEFFEQGFDMEGVQKAIELIKRNSRRYAKRQLTWFRKNQSIRWFHPQNLSEIITHVETQLAENC